MKQDITSFRNLRQQINIKEKISPDLVGKNYSCFIRYTFQFYSQDLKIYVKFFDEINGSQIIFMIN